MTGVYSPDDDPRVRTSVTQRQLFDAVQQIQTFIATRADRTDAIIHEHARDDATQFADLQKRLLTIEVQRSEEKAQTLKRATTIGMGTAAGMSVLLKLIDHFWK